MTGMPDPSPETIIQHFAEEEHVKGAVVPPIFQNSLFVFESADEFEKSFDPISNPGKYNYSRTANPTLDIVERKLARLEHCDECKVFGSGMAAISAAILSCVESGAHVVCIDTAYGPTQQFLRDYLPRFGVQTTFVEGLTPDEIFDACRPETKLIYLESPGSIIFRIQDLEAIARFAKGRGIKTAIDNSYSTPLYQTPADFGIDIVVHTATKYLNGHSDVVSGVICCATPHMEKIRSGELPLLGGILGPFPAWLLLRGLRTLKVRLQAHQAAADQVAAYLLAHSKVEHVFHVGLPDHPQRELIAKQMRGYGGLLTFQPKCQDKEALKRFAERLRVYQMGVSWGGFESLCVPLPFKTLSWPEERWLVRLFCGLESPEDLIADLDQAFRDLPG